MSVKRSQEWIEDIMSGRLDIRDAPASMQSYVRYFIYEAALGICSVDDREQRRIKVDKLPEKIRPHVEAEVRRLWPMRTELVAEAKKKGL